MHAFPIKLKNPTDTNRPGPFTILDQRTAPFRSHKNNLLSKNQTVFISSQQSSLRTPLEPFPFWELKHGGRHSRAVQQSYRYLHFRAE